MTLTLHVEPAQGRPYSHHVDADEMLIGRAASCDLVLADRYLQVDLAVIAGFFLICCLLTPLCVWLFHRARDPFAMDDVRGL